MEPKPKFVTKWQGNRLVPVAVQGGPPELEVITAVVEGQRVVVFVGTDDAVIYRDSEWGYCGAV